jgi:hypothetical protein
VILRLIKGKHYSIFGRNMPANEKYLPSMKVEGRWIGVYLQGSATFRRVVYGQGYGL